MTSHAVAERIEASLPVVETGAALTPMQMAFQLIQGGADLGSVKEMLAMSREMAADQARRAFDGAMSEAKAQIKPVIKASTGHNSKLYADFASIAKAVDPIISKFGLSYRFRTTQDDRINVTCILSHKDGHSEETTLSGPADSTGNKNAIQAIGSTLTYLQRYSLVQALGLAAAQDDDGNAAGIGAAISGEQREHLLELIVEVGADIAKFCNFFKIEAIPDLPAAKFDQAVKMVEAKRGHK